MKSVESNIVIESKKDAIIGMAVDALFVTLIVDEFGIIRHISQNYANYFNMSPEEIVGCKVEEIIPTTNVYHVLETGEAEIRSFFELQDGRSLICNRLPIKNDLGITKGVICMSTLDTPNTVKSLYNSLKELEIENEIFMKQLKGLNAAPFIMDSIAGVSPQIMEIKRQLRKVINCGMPILLTGESGTGKEVFANAIHHASNRKEAPFVKVNCAAIPKELLESELFGYEPGTFSGAIKSGRAGKFELANNGTILLDEIEELPLAMQSKFLRVLQEYEVERIGSIKSIPLNIQVICCSNKDLYRMTEEGRFREDLLFRINVMEIEIPPLRERMEDIPGLCNVLIDKINNKYKLHIDSLTNSAIEYLCSYNWPGNIRELEHVIERACALSETSILKVDDFKFLDRKKEKSIKKEYLFTNKDGLHENKNNAEREIIIAALKKTNNNRTHAAKLLGISRSMLYTKISKYEL